MTMSGAVAFAFDLDETLVDAERHHVEATRAMLHALDLTPRQVAHDVFHDATGKRTRDIVDAFRVATGLPHSLDELLALRHSAFLASLDRDPPEPMPGAREAVEAARALGPVALVSSGHRDDILATLHATRLAPLFDIVVTGEDVEEPKPHPEPYVVAASRLGVRASALVAFEDSARGVLAARAAGCRVVAVPHARTTPRGLVEADADVVLDSLLEALPLEALLARLR